MTDGFTNVSLRVLMPFQVNHEDASIIRLGGRWSVIGYPYF
jgi:hypothetical protein